MSRRRVQRASSNRFCGSSLCAAATPSTSRFSSWRSWQTSPAQTTSQFYLGNPQYYLQKKKVFTFCRMGGRSLTGPQLKFFFWPCKDCNRLNLTRLLFSPRTLYYDSQSLFYCDFFQRVPVVHRRRWEEQRGRHHPGNRPLRGQHPGSHWDLSFRLR